MALTYVFVNVHLFKPLLQMFFTINIVLCRMCITLSPIWRRLFVKGRKRRSGQRSRMRLKRLFGVVSCI